MKADRDLANAAPILQDAIPKLLADMKTLGFPMFVCEVARFPGRQRELWSVGRVYDDVTRRWKVVDPRKVVTWSPPGSSKHETLAPSGRPQSEAVDLAFEQTKERGPFDLAWPWEVMQALAERKYGLRCVSTWNPKKRRMEGDLGHVQTA